MVNVFYKLPANAVSVLVDIVYEIPSAEVYWDRQTLPEPQKLVILHVCRDYFGSKGRIQVSSPLRLSIQLDFYADSYTSAFPTDPPCSPQLVPKKVEERYFP